MNSTERILSMIDRTGVQPGRVRPDRIPILIMANWDYFCVAAGLNEPDRSLWRYFDADLHTDLVTVAFKRHPLNDLVFGGPTTIDPNYPYRWRKGESEWLVEDPKGNHFRVETDADTPAIRKGGKRIPIDGARPKPTDAIRIDSLDQVKRMLARPSGRELRDEGTYYVASRSKKQLGDDAFVIVDSLGVFVEFIRYLGGSKSLDGGGFETAMTALYDDERLASAVMERVIERQLEQVDCAAASGVDGILISSYWEGMDIISPSLWRKFSKPGVQALAERAHRRGMKAFSWFLGDCIPVLEDLIETGIDVLMLEQERRGYTSDPVVIRQHVGDRLCITGWSDELAVVADRRDILTRNVAHQIVAAETGPYMASTSYLGADASVEAVEFYCREVLRQGQQLTL